MILIQIYIRINFQHNLVSGDVTTCPLTSEGLVHFIQIDEQWTWINANISPEEKIEQFHSVSVLIKFSKRVKIDWLIL